MAFIGTFKNNHTVKLPHDIELTFKTGEQYDVVYEGDGFYLIDAGASLAIEKHLMVLSGIGVEWYSNSFHGLYKDKTSWKKKFRMHIAEYTEEKRQWTYDINLRLLNDTWKMVEVNEYTNGTDANKIGLVEEEKTLSRIRSLLEEDKKYHDMMAETQEALKWIDKVSNGNFIVAHVNVSPSYYSEEYLNSSVILNDLCTIGVYYQYKEKQLEFCNLHVGNIHFNIKRTINEEVREKLITSIEAALYSDPDFTREKGLKFSTTILRVYPNGQCQGYIDGIGNISVFGGHLQREVKKGDVVKVYKGSEGFIAERVIG
ncbi:hypothetical protein QTG56_25885 (plasmid) [Rossellomorea sp. AcN35-11]|nr:hypothetical protein [Rossellomorea aquimaris]WJV32048.1 hypothetical protein QTG56_25885 [Rossellomorea sp. AcN35-11]